MPDYDATLFAPPAPLAYVTLIHPDTLARQTAVPMLLDSGSDVTLVPAEAVQVLGVQFTTDRSYELEGFDHGIVQANAVQLDMRFAGRIFHGGFLVVEQAWGIIGRNVLNHLPILLDGPNLQWHALAHRRKANST